jgi:hypothetical protein
MSPQKRETLGEHRPMPDRPGALVGGQFASASPTFDPDLK